MSEVPPAAIEVTDREIRTHDGHRIFCRDVSPAVGRPQRGAVIFCHGNTFPSLCQFDLNYEDYSLARYLASAGIRCLCFDHRGYGHSGPPHTLGPVTMADKLVDLAAVHGLARQRHLDRAIGFLGLSIGCNTIAHYLDRHRLQVLGVCFMGPAYHLDEMAVAWGRKRNLIRLGLRMLGRGRQWHIPVSPTRIRRRIYMGNESRISSGAMQAFIDTAVAEQRLVSPSLVSPVLSFPEAKPRPDRNTKQFPLGGLDVPLLIQWGQLDNICSRRTVERLQRDLGSRPHHHLRVYADRGHDLCVHRHHDDVFADIAQFLHAPKLRSNDIEIRSCRSQPRSSAK